MLCWRVRSCTVRLQLPLGQPPKPTCFKDLGLVLQVLRKVTIVTEDGEVAPPAQTLLEQLGFMRQLQSLEAVLGAEGGTARPLRFPAFAHLTFLRLELRKGVSLEVQPWRLPALQELALLGGGRVAVLPLPSGCTPSGQLASLTCHADQAAIHFGALASISELSLKIYGHLDGAASMSAATQLTALRLSLPPRAGSPPWLLPLLRSALPSLRSLQLRSCDRRTPWSAATAEAVGSMSQLTHLDLYCRARGTPQPPVGAPVWSGLRTKAITAGECNSFVCLLAVHWRVPPRAALPRAALHIFGLRHALPRGLPGCRKHAACSRCPTALQGPD